MKKNFLGVVGVAMATLLLVGCKDLKGKVSSEVNKRLPFLKTEEVATVQEGEELNWDIATYPDYYAVAGESGVNEAEFPEAGKIVYGELDYLGRTTQAKGSLTFTNVEGSYGVRQKFGSDADPSGWQKQEQKAHIAHANGKAYNGYFWNRSHLIGDALGGDAIRQNVITGTRTQNVGQDSKGGMRYSEIKAQKWLEDNQTGVLYYGATPVYVGEELVPRYVEVVMKSSDGTIDEKVIVFNTANGYEINYSDGTFSPIE